MYTGRTSGAFFHHRDPMKRLGFLLLFLAIPASAVAAPVDGKDKGAARGAQSQVQFGVDMAQRGLWSEALFRFRQAERLGDSRASVFNNIAVAYEALGLFDQAQTYYKKALDQDPRNAGAKRNYSRFVEFYQSFKPDQPGAQPPEEDQPATAGDGEHGKPMPTAPIDQPPSEPVPPSPPVNPS
jgi:tetratricopeptide (TPR) repeat protein